MHGIHLLREVKVEYYCTSIHVLCMWRRTAFPLDMVNYSPTVGSKLINSDIDINQ